MALQRLSYARSSGLFSSPFVLSDLGEPPLLLRDLQPDLYAFDDVDTHPSHLSTMKWSRSVGPKKNFTPPRIALDLSMDDLGADIEQLGRILMLEALELWTFGWRERLF